MSAYFVCLDTNVLFDLVQDLEAGDEPKWWLDLKKLVEAGEAKALVPEITLLEMETCLRDAEHELGVAMKKAEQAAHPQVSETLRKDLSATLTQWWKKKVERWKAQNERLDQWLHSQQFIKFTNEISHQTKVRLIAGRLPRSDEKEKDASSSQKKWLRDQDCAIIDSLVWWFENNKNVDAVLLFGTNDKKNGGFGQVEDGKGSLDKEKFAPGVGVLDGTFSKGLPPSQLFHDMTKLVKFVTDKETVKRLTPERAEAVQEQDFKREATVVYLEPVRATARVLPISVIGRGIRANVNGLILGQDEDPFAILDYSDERKTPNKILDLFRLDDAPASNDKPNPLQSPQENFPPEEPEGRADG